MERHYIYPFEYRLRLCVKKFTKNNVMSVLVWSPLEVSLSLGQTTLVSLRGSILIFQRASLSLLCGSPHPTMLLNDSVEICCLCV